MNLSKTVADDLLQFEKIENWCLLKLTGRKAVVNGSHCSKLNEHQWSNYLQIIWDYILFHSPIYKYGRNSAKKKWVLFKCWHQEIQKVNFVRKKI